LRTVAFYLLFFFCGLLPFAEANETGDKTQQDATTQPKMRTQSEIPEIPVSSNLLFQPRVWTGTMNYKLNSIDETTKNPGQPNSSTTSATQDLDLTVPTLLGLGGTLVYKGFFLDVYGQKASDGEEEKPTNTVQLGNQQVTRNKIFSVEREDYSATLGYKVLDGLVMFAGYRIGQTSIEEFTRYSTGSSARESIKFNANGPFVGLSYSYPISEYGQLGINLGYAQLEGEYTQRLVGSTGSTDYSGSTAGLTYGVNWRGKIYKNLGYSISADKFDYQFDFDPENGVLPDAAKTPVRRKLEAQEELLTFKFTLSYTF